jgi:molybdopterin-binding protein
MRLSARNQLNATVNSGDQVVVIIESTEVMIGKREEAR